MYLTKFTSLGYKYVLLDGPSKTIKIFNLNNSLFSSIQIPSIALSSNPNIEVNYVSDNLFDLDNNIEYVLYTYTSSVNPFPPKTYIFKDNGTQIFYKDSSSRVSNSSTNGNNVFSNYDNVFFDGLSTKLKVIKVTGSQFSQINRYEIYNLPGVIPCIQCSATGTTIGRPEYQGNNNSEPLFYPNPVNDQIKLKYDLPKNYKSAEIRVQDMQGKLLETYKVTSDFDFIYVPSNYTNGLYLYSLVVDGAVIKTEKIILSKN